MSASTSVTSLGNGVMAVAVPWLAKLLTPDPVLIGLVARAPTLSWFWLSRPAGVITGRFAPPPPVNLRRWHAGRAVTGAGGAGLTANPGTAPVLAMAVLTFLLCNAEALRDNTAQTLVPTVVDKSQLEQASRTLWAGEHLAGQFTWPPLAGLLIGASVALPFGVLTGLLATGMALIVAIPLPRPGPAVQQTRSVWSNGLVR